MSPRLAILLSAAFLLGGCEVVTELGKPCFLVRKATDAELAAGSARAVPLKEKELTKGQDFISFGAADCEDFVCVRDADTPGDSNPEAVALGYCSRPCAEGGNSCQVTNSEAVSGLSERMTCRALLMDDAALARLKASDPETYRKTFGTQTSSTFCAGKLTEAPADSQGN